MNRREKSVGLATILKDYSMLCTFIYFIPQAMFFYPEHPVQTPVLDSPFLDTKNIYLLSHTDKNLRALFATLCIYYIHQIRVLLSVLTCEVKALSKKFIHSSYWSAVSDNRVMQTL